MKGQGARFEEAGFLMVESCLMVGDGLFFCGSFFRALSQPHTMLFALVPLNELSSSFTRIDGTVFDGTPSEFCCLTRVGSAPCPLLHGAGPTKPGTASRLAVARGGVLGGRPRAGAGCIVGARVERRLLTACAPPLSTRCPRTTRACAGASGFSMLDDFTFNGSTTTNIDTRYGGTEAARALHYSAPPHPALPSPARPRAALGVVLSCTYRAASSLRPALPAGLPRPVHPSRAPAPDPSRARAHWGTAPCCLARCDLATWQKPHVSGSRSHSWLCVRACVRACVRRKVREAPYVRLGGWVASQSEERAILGILTRRVFQAAPAPPASKAAPRPSPTAVATARAAPPSWSTAAWRRRSCKRASTFLLSFTIHLRGRESNRCQQRCTKGSAQGLVMCVCFV